MVERQMRSSTARGDIACPACGFSPSAGMLWLCAPDGCGAMFDTFATHARCPQCEAHFQWTACPVCQKATAHEAWYH